MIDGKEEIKEIIEEEKVNNERTESVMKISKKILQMIGENDVLLGDMTPEERSKAYVPMTEEMIEYLLKEDVVLGDISFAFRLALQAFDSFSTATNNTVDRMRLMVLNKKFGKEYMDIKMSDIKEALDE